MKRYAISNDTRTTIAYLCALGTASTLLLEPVSLAYQESPDFRIFTYVVIIILTLIFYDWLIWLSSRTLDELDFEPFVIRDAKQIAFYSLLSGIALGALGSILLNYPALTAAEPTTLNWRSLLPSLNAFNLEVTFRLFFLPWILFIIQTLFSTKHPWTVWVSIGITALSSVFFPQFHLGSITPPSFKVPALNILAGALFGWLFYRYGYWVASFAHLIAGIIISIYLPTVGAAALLGIALLCCGLYYWYSKKRLSL